MPSCSFLIRLHPHNVALTTRHVQVVGLENLVCGLARGGQLEELSYQRASHLRTSNSWTWADYGLTGSTDTPHGIWCREDT
jgi:hypothetical protein